MRGPGPSIIRFLLALSLLAGAPSALADWNFSAQAPDTGKVVPVESLRMVPGTAPALRLQLGEADAEAIKAVRRANASPANKRLQIGVGRDVPRTPETRSAALQWESVPGGLAAHWRVSSAGARALRIGLDVSRLGGGTQVRFAGGDGAGTVYGPFTAADAADTTQPYWSPVLEGESAIVELFVARGGSTAGAEVSITHLSHLFVGPVDRDLERLAKLGESQSCEVDLICRSPADAALENVGRAVAKMTFTDGMGSGTFLCTGTLLNPVGGSFTPYFYSAAHCMATQASASTLTTHWFYDRTGCGTGGVGGSYVQVTGGATLLYANTTSDVLFLRLNSSPPQAAVFAGWEATSLAVGTALTAVHHPAGDVKKVSLGTMLGFDGYNGVPGPDDHIDVGWNSLSTGVTEGGSSGSGIFSAIGQPASDYRLRGGLHGGPSSCTATGASLRDYYSRFDQAYPFLAPYLNPTSSCTFTLTPASAFVAAGATTGAFTVTTGAGCTWSATSNAPWLTTSSSGNGSGTVSYAVAANSGAARAGSIGVGGQVFSLNQAAGAGGTPTSVIANGGFESGSTSWTQSATTGAPIIVTNAPAHSGSGVAWLGGAVNSTDSLYQDVSIPAGASSVTLQYWYRITTNETIPSAFDTLTVTIQSPVSGATLATVATYSNLNATSTWTQSPAFTLSGVAGQTIRLRFTAVNDFSDTSSFYVDDITLTAVTAGTPTGNNYTALWWNPAENGWGINFNHQGTTLFGTLFTYDASGQALWLVMSGGVGQPDGVTFTGELYFTNGPPFNAVPFTPITAANLTQVGTMTVTFTSANSAALTYSVNGVVVTKSIQRQVYGTRAATCTLTSGSRVSLTNYQDLWWNPAESGWGINVTHQDNTLFATLFTYDATGQGMWLVMSGGIRQPDGSYLGELYRTTGPPFNAVPFTPITLANLTQVGLMRFTFTNGENATLSYTVNGIAVTKAITRQVFATTFPACSS